jgi:hypothetical protein
MDLYNTREGRLLQGINVTSEILNMTTLSGQLDQYTCLYYT